MYTKITTYSMLLEFAYRITRTWLLRPVRAVRKDCMLMYTKITTYSMLLELVYRITRTWLLSHVRAVRMDCMFMYTKVTTYVQYVTRTRLSNY